MEQKLRRKFVIVTTVLMLIVFGIFFITNSLYNKYWNDMTVTDMLGWIADSGIFNFETNDRDFSKEELIERITQNEQPVYGVLLDKQGNILRRRVIGSTEGSHLYDQQILQMFEMGADNYKLGKFLYEYHENKDGTILIVTMDSTANNHSLVRGIGIVILGAFGVVLLLFITFFLSRFVTEPAKLALDREKNFISDASHELKTPLGAISVNAQALEAQNVDNIYVKNIINESNRMGRLIENLLQLSKLDEKLEVNQAHISLSDLVMEMVLTYESVAFEQHIEYEYHIENELIINGDQDEIRQLLAILIDNALKHTPEHGKITVVCRSSGGNSVLEIINTGEGISPKDLEHIFERFYTTDASRNKGSFGLGLAIAKSIVERHDGEIWAESTVGKQTTFTVVF